MAIDIEKEDVLSLTEATKVLPRVNGKRPAICTLWRWCRKGLRGIHLDYIRIGRGIATSRQALNRFFNELSAKDEPLVTPPAMRQFPPVTSRSRQRAIEDAERICQEAGI
jgi:hypothetical protein